MVVPRMNNTDTATPATDATNDILGFGDVNEPSERAENVIGTLLKEFPESEWERMLYTARAIAEDDISVGSVNSTIARFGSLSRFEQSLIEHALTQFTATLLNDPRHARATADSLGASTVELAVAALRIWKIVEGEESDR